MVEPNEILDFISKRIIDLRTKRDISARQLSLDLGLGVGYIITIESKKSFPSLQNLYSIIDYFGITPSEFFKEEITYRPLIADLMRELDKMDDDQLMHLAAIVKDMNK